MKPPPLTYHRPETIGEAAALLAEYGDEAKVLAGGQSLMPMLNLRLASVSHLVDITRIPELGKVHTGDGTVRIGAAVRQARVEDDAAIPQSCPLLAEALPHLAHREIRNAGTVCGSAAHADPAAEIPAVTLASGAAFELTGVRGSRTVAADSFFTGYLTTALEPDELLSAVSFPVPPPGTGTAFLEVAQRQGDYALAGIAVTVRLEHGPLHDIGLAYLGLSTTPVAAPEVAELLEGSEPSDELFTAAAERASATLPCIDGTHAGKDYRRRVAGTLTRRALATACARAQEGIPAQVGSR
jgi:aerobic carbon-monoxide dehydrogenase medium subunit